MAWDRRVAACAVVLSVSSALAVLAGCGHRVLAPQLHEPDQVPRPDPHVPILKVHMKSGELYLLGTWHASADGRTLDGTGTRYSISRVAGTPGRVSIPSPTWRSSRPTAPSTWVPFRRVSSPS